MYVHDDAIGVEYGPFYTTDEVVQCLDSLNRGELGWDLFYNKLKAVVNREGLKMSRSRNGNIIIEAPDGAPLAIVKPDLERLIVKVDTWHGLTGTYPMNHVGAELCVRLALRELTY